MDHSHSGWTGYRGPLKLLPGGAVEERHRLGRSFTHVNLRLACEYVVTPNNTPKEVRPIAAAAAGSAALLDVADALLSLQEARHRADYDHLGDFTKVDVLQYIDVARDAVAKVSQLGGTTDLQRFVSLLALRPALR